MFTLKPRSGKLSFPVFTLIRRVFLPLALVAVFAFTFYWLWNRQPNSTQKKEAVLSEAAQQELPEQKQEGFRTTEPKDNSVILQSKSKIKGIAYPNSYVAIYSNFSSKIVKANEKGDFETEIELAGGINFINLTSFNDALAQEGQTAITIFATSDKKITSQTVFAGSVKNILGNAITVSTKEFEGTISTDKNTTFEIPKDEEEATVSAIKNVRLGDYAIALGEIGKDNNLKAKSVEIVRENKPQNTRNFAIVQILTTPKQNAFKTKNDKDAKTIDLTLSKTSQVIIEDKVQKPEKITKNKKAIIIYHKDEGDNIVELIYQFP